MTSVSVVHQLARCLLNLAIEINMEREPVGGKASHAVQLQRHPARIFSGIAEFGGDSVDGPLNSVAAGRRYMAWGGGSAGGSVSGPPEIL